MKELVFPGINVWAVLVVWVVHIVMGLVWFQPKLFGNAWMKLTNRELTPDTKWVAAAMLGHLSMAFVLAVLIKLAGVNTGIGGVVIGLLAWIGFIVPLEAGELVWERIPFKLFLIRIGNHFAGLAVAGFILGSWK